MRQHASQKFQAPGSIQRGIPLKQVLGKDLIQLVGESLGDVCETFNRKSFEQQAMLGLEELEFSQRGKHIGRALAEQLTGSFATVSPILLASFGPELTATEGNGLAPFFYLPHAHFIAERGLEDFEHGMLANYELTKRFTAEFCIRPFLVKYRDKCLARFNEWVADPNPHVRRLVSEGTRPRLPWAMRLKDFQQNPELAIPLLEQLKDDSELYVRRSVANHMADILKDHPEVVYKILERWLNEVCSTGVDQSVAKARKWIIRHAVRLPAKQGNSRATALRVAAK